MNNTELIQQMQDAIYEARQALENFQRNQDDASDTGNEQTLMQATAALDSFEGHVTDLVP